MSMPANMTDLPPWERIELPAFQIDGEKFGGPAIAVGSGSSLWSGWKGLGGRKRPSTGSSMVSPQLQEAPRFGSISSSVDDGTFSPRGVAGELKASAQTLVGPQMEIIASGDNPEAPRDYSSSISPLSENVIDDVPRKRHRRANFQGTVTDSSWCTHKMSSHGSFTPSNLSRSDKSSALETHRPSVATVIDSIESIQTPKKLSVPSIAFDNDAFIPAVEQLPTAQSQPVRPLSPIFSQSAPSSRSRSSSQPRTTPFSNPKSLHSRQHTLSGPDIGTSSAPAALEDDDLDEEMDLMKMLAAAPPKVDDRFALPPGEQYELVPESMSSYLNRKTAMLMLWFPLGVSLYA